MSKLAGVHPSWLKKNSMSEQNVDFVPVLEKTWLKLDNKTKKYRKYKKSRKSRKSKKSKKNRKPNKGGGYRTVVPTRSCPFKEGKLLSN